MNDTINTEGEVIAFAIIEDDDIDITVEPIVNKEDDNVVHDFLEKRKAQFKAIKLDRRRIKIYITIGIISIISLTVLLLESPVFSVNKLKIVEAKGSPKLSAENLASLNKDLSNIKGQQMYRSNFDASQSKLNKLTYVENVTFKKEWPSSVTVTIKQRTPIATIKTDKGYVLIDSKNIVFAKVAEYQMGLPVLRGFDNVTMSKAINDVNYLKIIKDAPDEIDGQIAYVEKKESKYEVTLTDGILIKLGDISLLKEKLSIAWSIILTKNRADLGYIDVSVPSLPVTAKL